MDNFFWFLLAAVAAALLYLIYIYNSLVRKKAHVENGLSQIDVQLKRRYDLIPNLVETVKAYAVHERGIFERIAALRSASLSATTLEETAPIENQLTGALKSLLAVSENYPELKADRNFLALQEELSSTENKIAFARQYYNDAVRDHNITISVFPNNILSARLGYSSRPLWTVDDAAERETVPVSFGEDHGKL
ncbi:MAG: LemA family protein [Synergistaceae bacterium]|nr:LemA family protein [Synergistaceae bacterium]